MNGLNKQLYRSRSNRVVAGICGGIGEYFQIDPTIIRLAWIFAALSLGFGVLGYLIAWVIIPEAPEY